MITQVAKNVWGTDAVNIDSVGPFRQMGSKSAVREQETISPSEIPGSKQHLGGEAGSKRASVWVFYSPCSNCICSHGCFPLLLVTSSRCHGCFIFKVSELKCGADTVLLVISPCIRGNCCLSPGNTIVFEGNTVWEVPCKAVSLDSNYPETLGGWQRACERLSILQPIGSTAGEI